jgi:hypothetical protein
MFFNKWELLWCCGILLLLLSPSAGHDGVERGGMPAAVVEDIGEYP